MFIPENRTYKIQILVSETTFNHAKDESRNGNPTIPLTQWHSEALDAFLDKPNEGEMEWREKVIEEGVGINEAEFNRVLDIKVYKSTSILLEKAAVHHFGRNNLSTRSYILAIASKWFFYLTIPD